MKKLLVAAAILALLLTATVAFAEDKKEERGTADTSLGQVSVYGVFKAGFNYYVGDEQLEVTTDKKTGAKTLGAVDRKTDMEFAVNYFGFGLKGWVVDKRVTYDVSVVAGENSPIYPDGASPVDDKGNALAGKLSTIMVNDMKLGFHYIPYVGIYIGRILPAFTYFNSIPNQNFKTIEQPLVNQNVVHRDRETGLNLALVTDYVDANLGVYNGRQYFPTYMGYWGFLPKDANNPVGNVYPLWGDENTAKDIHFGVVGKPLSGMGKAHVDDLRIRAALWYGMPLDGWRKDTKNNFTAHNAAVTFIDADVDYLAPFGLTIVGEIFYGSYMWDKKDPSKNFTTDRLGAVTGKADSTANSLTTLSYNIMAGYNFGPLLEVPIELLVRYDWWDPDTLNNKKNRPTSVNDQLTDITGGFNYYIKYYNAMIRLDYIHHAQQWSKVENVAATGVQTGIHNDALKVEAQVSF